LRIAFDQLWEMAAKRGSSRSIRRRIRKVRASFSMTVRSRGHRHEHGLHGLLEGALRRDDPIEDGFAILMLAQLEVGGVVRRLDEIPGRVDEKQPVLAAFALPGQEDGGIRRGPLLDDSLSIL
jgi:hypothetical protein